MIKYFKSASAQPKIGDSCQWLASDGGKCGAVAQYKVNYTPSFVDENGVEQFQCPLCPDHAEKFKTKHHLPEPFNEMDALQKFYDELLQRAQNGEKIYTD